jgi:hypothetical protein
MALTVISSLCLDVRSLTLKIDCILIISLFFCIWFQNIYMCDDVKIESFSNI